MRIGLGIRLEIGLGIRVWDRARDWIRVRVINRDRVR